MGLSNPCLFVWQNKPGAQLQATQAGPSQSLVGWPNGLLGWMLSRCLLLLTKVKKSTPGLHVNAVSAKGWENQIVRYQPRRPWHWHLDLHQPL